MKRYLAFLFYAFYPSGGANDFIGAFDSVEEAREAIEKCDDRAELAHIFDVQDERVVLEWVNPEDCYGGGWKVPENWQPAIKWWK